MIKNLALHWGGAVPYSGKLRMRVMVAWDFLPHYDCPIMQQLYGTCPVCGIDGKPWTHGLEPPRRRNHCCSNGFCRPINHPPVAESLLLE